LYFFFVYGSGPETVDQHTQAKKKQQYQNDHPGLKEIHGDYSQRILDRKAFLQRLPPGMVYMQRQILPLGVVGKEKQVSIEIIHIFICLFDKIRKRKAQNK
jgi:hypothetical protein